MTTTVVEILRVTRSLPPRKAAQVLDYARSLAKPAGKTKAKHKAAKEVNGDAEWERIINEGRPRPKLDAKIKALERLAAQSEDEPMDFDRL